MNTAVINVKTNSSTKAQAQKIAKEMGVSLSALINAYLSQPVKTKKVTVDVSGEEPSEYLIKSIRRAERDRKQGKASPIFDTGKEAVKWLEEQGI